MYVTTVNPKKPGHTDYYLSLNSEKSNEKINLKLADGCWQYFSFAVLICDAVMSASPTILFTPMFMRVMVDTVNARKLFYNLIVIDPCQFSRMVLV